MIATPAFESVINDSRVSKLARHSRRTLNQLVIENEADAYAFGYSDRYQIAHSQRLAAEPEFRESERIGSVFQFHRESGGLFDCLF